ncbi:MAG: hypothetical protein ACKO96_01365, partial [Flammeovirgaceae bacterium]
GTLTRGFNLAGNFWTRVQFNTAASPSAFSTTATQNYYVGYTRPDVGNSITTYNGRSTLYISNSYGFYCTSSGNADNYYYTNYIPYSSTVRNMNNDYEIGYNVVDWSNPAVPSTMTTIKLSSDIG